MVNRIILADRVIPMGDVLTPTEERLQEERAERGRSRFAP